MKKPIATSIAILENKGKILLVKRGVEPFKGKWALPGGHIELMEKATDGIIREVKEEVGVDFQPEYIGYIDEFIPEFKWHSVVMLFTGKFVGEPIIGDETLDIGWFTPEEALKKDLALFYKEMIEKWINR